MQNEDCGDCKFVQNININAVELNTLSQAVTVSQVRSVYRTEAATARSACLVLGEPRPEVLQVTSVAALRAERSEAGTGQAADDAADRDGVAENTPRPLHRLSAVPAADRDDGGVVVALVTAGQTLQDLRAGSEHFPPVEKVSVGLHVGVVELVVVGADHARHLSGLSRGVLLTVGRHLPVLQAGALLSVRESSTVFLERTRVCWSQHRLGLAVFLPRRQGGRQGAPVPEDCGEHCGRLDVLRPDEVVDDVLQHLAAKRVGGPGRVSTSSRVRGRPRG